MQTLERPSINMWFKVQLSNCRCSHLRLPSARTTPPPSFGNIKLRHFCCANHVATMWDTG